MGKKNDLQLIPLTLHTLNTTPCFVMEFPCPKCGKDISLLDGHVDKVFQLVRCGNCGTEGMLIPYQSTDKEWHMPFYEIIDHDTEYHTKLANEMAYLPTGIAIIEFKDDVGDIPDSTVFSEKVVPENINFFFASMISPTQGGMRVLIKRGVYPVGETMSSIILPYQHCCYNIASSFAFNINRELEGYAYTLPWVYNEKNESCTKIGEPGDYIESVIYNIIFNKGGSDGSFEPGITFGGSIAVHHKDEIKDISVIGHNPLSFYESLDLLKRHELDPAEVKDIPLLALNPNEQRDMTTKEIEEALLKQILGKKESLN